MDESSTATTPAALSPEPTSNYNNYEANSIALTSDLQELFRPTSHHPTTSGYRPRHQMSSRLESPDTSSSPDERPHFERLTAPRITHSQTRSRVTQTPIRFHSSPLPTTIPPRPPFRKFCGNFINFLSDIERPEQRVRLNRVLPPGRYEVTRDGKTVCALAEVTLGQPPVDVSIAVRAEIHSYVPCKMYQFDLTLDRILAPGRFQLVRDETWRRYITAGMDIDYGWAPFPQYDFFNPHPAPRFEHPDTDDDDS